LETCSEKPEVDIMMPSLVSEAKLFSDNGIKNNSHIQLKTRWDFAKTRMYLVWWVTM